MKTYTLFGIVLTLIASGSSQYIPDDFCKGIMDGIFKHPDETNCREFVVCFLETPFVINCPSGNIFHPPVNNCIPGEKWIF